MSLSDVLEKHLHEVREGAESPEVRAELTRLRAEVLSITGQLASAKARAIVAELDLAKHRNALRAAEDQMHQISQPLLQATVGMQVTGEYNPSSFDHQIRVDLRISDNMMSDKWALSGQAADQLRHMLDETLRKGPKRAQEGSEQGGRYRAISLDECRAPNKPYELSVQLDETNIFYRPQRIGHKY